MKNHVRVTGLALLAFSLTAQAQVRRIEIEQNEEVVVQKARSTVNKAMNTSSGIESVLFDRVLGVMGTGIVLKASNRVFSLDATLSASAIRSINSSVKASISKNREVEVKLSAGGNVVSVRLLSVNEAKARNPLRANYLAGLARRANRPLNTEPRVPFQPTTVSSVNQAQGIFFADGIDPLNQDYMDLSDNCFNRSHYWARHSEIGAAAQFDVSARKTTGTTIAANANPLKVPLFSEKIFVLFTERYQKTFNHKWWYHTAPTVRVLKGGGHEVYVLDRSYMQQAVSRSAWLKAFAGHAYEKSSKWDGSGCKPLKNLSEFFAGNQTEMCYYTEGQNMYTYLPTDLNTPNAKTDWDCLDFYELIQGVPYPDPRRTHLGGMDYNTYVRDFENQKGWMRFIGGKYMPIDCRPQ